MPIEPNSIYVENLHLQLSADELNEIVNVLKQNEIEINFIENNEPRASLFEAISIIFNDSITKQILLNLLSASAFEAIKFSLYPLYNCLKKFKIIKLRSKQEQASLNIIFKTDNCRLNIPIPSNLPKDQFSAYLDMAHKTVIELGKTSILKSTEYNEYVLEGEDSQGKSLKIKTIVEYVKEQHAKQKKS